MYHEYMNFTQNLKQVAQEIIELSAEMGDVVHTWKQQADKINENYSDRTGYVSYSDVELNADIFLEDDQPNGLLRARLAYAPGDAEIFTIITLHFDTDRDKAAQLISNTKNVSQELISELLHEETTTPILIQVSLKSGPGGVGKRFEYTTDQINSLSEDNKIEFLSTLREAFSHIKTKNNN